MNLLILEDCIIKGVHNKLVDVQYPELGSYSEGCSKEYKKGEVVCFHQRHYTDKTQTSEIRYDSIPPSIEIEGDEAGPYYSLKETLNDHKENKEYYELCIEHLKHSDEDPWTPSEEIENQIQEYKKEIEEMNNLIHDLENGEVELLNELYVKYGLLDMIKEKIAPNRRVFVDMDGTLAEWNNVEVLEQLYEKDYFGSLKPYTNVVDAIKELNKNENIEFFILSKYLPDSKYSLIEKNEWLDKYLPEIEEDKRIFVKDGELKSVIMNERLGLRDSDILIDDYNQNLYEWQSAGGTAIKIKNGINHNRGTWEGLLLSRESNCLAKEMNEIIFEKTMGEELKELSGMYRGYQESSRNLENLYTSDKLSVIEQSVLKQQKIVDVNLNQYKNKRRLIERKFGLQRDEVNQYLEENTTFKEDQGFDMDEQQMEN
ncbi:5' nucleotidase, NT5C type [Breznakia pachnodae]|uniref:Phosphoglycolate phosphatase-like HAD superfamily hydrolase n=1 Tax=Breznakia pachnodae TaxID=265178 RepID=A0ABU0E3U5_9FIRM|nr:hypothetical protein [Breznakia pachnodae]MDQ0361576.1 phosphoglycolate phosphatase-like HAD superfamily hydrolase [Breznakia pachnodae]